MTKWDSTSSDRTVFQELQLLKTEVKGVSDYSKVHSDTVQKYSITELECYGMYCVLCSLRILKSRYFHVVTDHSALVDMMKSEHEIPTLRLKKLFEKLQGFQFDLYYRKGQELYICDFLSRARYEADDITPNLPPMALPLHAQANITTRQQAKEQGIQIPTIAENVKILDNTTKRHRKPCKKQSKDLPRIQSPQIQDSHFTPHINEKPHSENGIDPVLTDRCDNITSPPPQNEPHTELPYSTETIQTECHIPPYYRQNTLTGKTMAQPPPRLDIPYRTEVPYVQTPPPSCETETVIQPSEAQYRTPHPLFDDLHNNDLKYSRNIPRQKDLQDFIQTVKKRCLGEFSIPYQCNEISQQQRQDPFFKDIFHYLNSNILPTNKRKADNIKRNAEDYVLVRQVLFKITQRPVCDTFRLLLCIPQVSVPYIIAMHHDSLFANHMGLTKTYYTMKNKYFIPKLYDKLAQYIQSCTVCQTRKKPQKGEETYEYIPRIETSFRIFDTIYLDVKHMFDSFDGFRYLLVIVDAATRFTLAYPMKRNNALTVAEILLQKICFFWGPIATIVTDAGSEFQNQIITYLTKALNIQTKICAEYMHESNLSERGIKTISQLLINRLQGHAKDWPIYINAITYSINTAQHRVLQGFSSYELVFGRTPKDFLNLDLDNHLPTRPLTYQDYAQSLKDRIQEAGNVALELHNNFQEQQRLHRAQQIKIRAPFQKGDLCYLLFPQATDLYTNTLKFKASFVGPLIVSEVLGDRYVTLTDLEGRQLYGVYSIKRLKRCHFRCDPHNVTSIAQLKESIARMDVERGKVPKESSFHSHSYLCMHDGSIPTQPSKDCTALKSIYHAKCTFPLEQYMMNCAFTTAAIPRPKNRMEVKKGQCQEEALPNQGNELLLVKARYKDGILQFLFSTEDKFTFWQEIQEDKILKDLGLDFFIEPEVDKNATPTGRLLLSIKCFQDQAVCTQRQRYPIRVTGSLLRFSRRWLGLPPYNQLNHLNSVKSVTSQKVKDVS